MVDSVKDLRPTHDTAHGHDSDNVAFGSRDTIGMYGALHAFTDMLQLPIG
jgi:hypothetical protein